jgi:ribosomal protein S18 acetylase RimI-like enzyme
VAIRVAHADGHDYLALATKLLHRVRLAHPTAGLWEAADLQWWWRKPRASDLTEQTFWMDGDGPVGAVVMTDWEQYWTCDVIVMPELRESALPIVWRHALESIGDLPSVEVLVRDDDAQLPALLLDADFKPTGERGGNTWMAAADHPLVPAPPDGFTVVDRARSAARPHPMRARNGTEVESRLRETSLYDPELDLAVFAPNGELAGYALFWNDPVTRVGMLEPMRTEDDYQRMGLATLLLTTGLERLADRGAERLKVGYSTDAARGLYVGAGFHTTSTDQSYRR